MTKLAYHLEERLLNEPNISSFHCCIFLPLDAGWAKRTKRWAGERGRQKGSLACPITITRNGTISVSVPSIKTAEKKVGDWSMWRYILRRSLLMIPIFLLNILLSTVLLNLFSLYKNTGFEWTDNLSSAGIEIKMEEEYSLTIFVLRWKTLIYQFTFWLVVLLKDYK